MKTLKILFLACAVSFSTLVKATPLNERFADTSSITHEIEMILQESHYILNEDLKVTVFFSISEDKTIQCLSVASGNEDLDSFIKRELENRLLVGQQWRKGMIYEISVDYSDTMLAYANL